MIFSFTTVIVEQKLLAVKLADKERWRRRQHEREVRSGENMDYVVLPHAAEERGEISDRGHDRANIFDRLQLSQYAWQTRIDRQKANLEPGFLTQAFKQTRRLNSLPTQDVKRWSNHQHAQGF